MHTKGENAIRFWGDKPGEFPCQETDIGQYVKEAETSIFVMLKEIKEEVESFQLT